MSFRFQLAPLLRLRQGQERQHALRLNEASIAVVRAQAELLGIDRTIAERIRADADSMQTGRCAAELQFAVLTRERMQALRNDVQLELTRLELVRHAAATEYRRAFREREGLESLAKRQVKQFQQERQQRDQRDLDETHLLQLWRKRSG
jgi:flagellar export protein FliJ